MSDISAWKEFQKYIQLIYPTPIHLVAYSIKRFHNTIEQFNWDNKFFIHVTNKNTLYLNNNCKLEFPICYLENSE